MFVVEELGTPFPNSFEKMACDYFYQEWSLTGELQKHATNMLGGDKHIRFKVGFPDYHKRYEVNFIKLRTEPKQDKIGGRDYECFTYMDVALRMKRLPRDTYVNTQLDEMEKEFGRICGDYEKQDQNSVKHIMGVRNIIWGGDERVYGGTDSYATSNWRSIGHFAFWYRMEQIDTV